MSKKTSALLYIVVGILLVIVSLAADFIGLGADPSVIGWKQLVGMAVGVVIAILGILRIRAKA